MTSTYSFITTSDISAAIVGAGFSSIYGLSTPPMVALQALVVSIVARLASDSSMLTSTMSTPISSSNKNQLIVGILSGIIGYYRNPKASMIKTLITGVSIDMLGGEVLQTFNFQDTVLLGGGPKV
jgi:hypothetical protein